MIPTLNSLSLEPINLPAGAGQAFDADAEDQFGASLPLPISNWPAGGGTVSNIGVFHVTAATSASTPQVSDSATISVPLSTPTLIGSESSDGTQINLSWGIEKGPSP